MSLFLVSYDQCSVSARHSTLLLPKTSGKMSWPFACFFRPRRGSRLNRHQAHEIPLENPTVENSDLNNKMNNYIFCFEGQSIHTSSSRVVKFAPFFWIILHRYYYLPIRYVAWTCISVTCPMYIEGMNIWSGKHQTSLSPRVIIRSMSPVLASFLPSVTCLNTYSRPLSIAYELCVFHWCLLQVW